MQNNEIDNIALLRLIRRRERIHHGLAAWVVSFIICVIAAIIVITGCVLIKTMLVNLQTERVPTMTGFPSVDSGIYPAPPIEAVE